MHPTFRDRFQSRGQALSLMGDPVREMSREELFAVIGFLLDMTDIDEVETQLSRYTPANAQREPAVSADPPSNDGLFEG